jgi:methyltransferase
VTPGVTLVAFLVVLAAQRIGELVVSDRNARQLEALGAREHAAGHFPLLVLVHILFPVLLVIEVLVLGARPGPAWPLWLVLWMAAQALRYAAVRALGVRWTVRIFVLPGSPLVTGGPYRWLRHPNYVAVVIELLAAPLLFGAWRTALVVGALNAIALRIRIRAEESALGG